MAKFRSSAGNLVIPKNKNVYQIVWDPVKKTKGQHKRFPQAKDGKILES